MIYVYLLQTVCSRESILNAYLMNIWEAFEKQQIFFQRGLRKKKR